MLLGRVDISLARRTSAKGLHETCRNCKAEVNGIVLGDIRTKKDRAEFSCDICGTNWSHVVSAKPAAIEPFVIRDAMSLARSHRREALPADDLLRSRIEKQSARMRRLKAEEAWKVLP